MPMISDGAESTPIEVRPSAPLELMWLVHDCGADHILEGPLATVEPLRTELGPRLRAFWGDGVRGFTELVVLAHRSGTMFDLDLDRFFAALEAAASDTGLPSLQSETAAERRALLARLERLRTDHALRAEYSALLKSVWDRARKEWETVGRPAVAAVAADWTARLAAGAPYRALLERPRIWPGRAELEELADAVAEDGRLVLSPGWFFGVIHVVDIDGCLYLGRRVRTLDEESARRMVAKHVAGSFKALADPTRLGIVLWLAVHPASITEIAKHFKLSQPTVSAHVQVLREAELLEEKASGRGTTLTVTEQRLKSMLNDVEEQLLRQFPKD